jgi:predicted CXXCH cytochrome family protein
MRAWRGKRSELLALLLCAAAALFLGCASNALSVVAQPGLTQNSVLQGGTPVVSPTLSDAAASTTAAPATLAPTLVPGAPNVPESPLQPPDGGLQVLATPGLPPPAPTGVPGPGDPHVAYGASTDSCAACHRSHSASGIVLRAFWPEENVCFICHGSQGPGTDVQSAFAAANTATRFFKHDVAATDGVHRIGQTDGADFGGAARHVECEDCHEPHEATRGPAVAPSLQREMNHTPGVDPMWTAPGAPNPAGFAWLPQAEREHQVCFKCHSAFTTLPTYLTDGWDGTQYVANGLSKLTSAQPDQVPDHRDLAQEFNPFNASFHPVVALGVNQAIPPNSFVPGWSQTSMVYCTDCHSHGSPRLHLLRGAVDYTTVMTGDVPAAQDQELCFRCHDAATYLDDNNSRTANTNFYRAMGNRNLHGTHMTRSRGRAATCYACHDTHGSEQQHLLNFQVLPGVLGIDSGDSQSAWRASGAQMECALTCHGRSHTRPGFRYP